VSEAEGHGAVGNAVVVTGAAGGIGAAVVRRLVADGWRVVATDVVAPSAFGDAVLSRAMDVTDPGNIATLARSLREDNVRVAGLVNGAGILQDVVPFLDMDPALERRVFEVNYFGALACCRAFGRMMAENGGGAIVNITSINETRPLPLHAYAPAKAALGAATALIAGDLGPSGVRVNAVAPGFTLTPIMRAKIEAGTRKAGTLEAHAALGRLVEPEEVAAVVAFLLSRDAAAITGASFPVDAGWLATAHWMNFRDLAAGPAR
jgi:NAD(P)-dependent dehydrogenase (short-subunit alcohol dehydrogenase family)